MWAARLPAQTDRYDAAARLQADRRLLLPAGGEDEGGPQRRVTCEGSSIVGVKMRIAASAAAIVGRKTNELSDRFVSLASACIVAPSMPFGVGEHRQRVSRKRPVREYVAELVG